MLPDRFWERVEKTPTCWLWTGATSQGYGHIRVNGKVHRAHRLSYEDAIGPVPDGLELDHLCHVTVCVNPAHLEAVTHSENMRRSITAVTPAEIMRRSITGQRSRQTHCLHGHPFAGDNLIFASKGRDCRTCQHEKALRRNTIRVDCPTCGRSGVISNRARHEREHSVSA